MRHKKTSFGPLTWSETDGVWWVFDIWLFSTICSEFLFNDSSFIMVTLMKCLHQVLLQQWPWFLQGPGFESHLWPVEFFVCINVSLLSNQTPRLVSVPCTSPIWLKSYRRHESNTKNAPIQNRRCLALAILYNILYWGLQLVCRLGTIFLVSKWRLWFVQT